MRLADVADILNADPRQAETLGAMEICPAPAAGQQRYLAVRQIQDVLLVRGVNLAEHRFSGASQVAVSGLGDAPAVSRVRPLASPDAARAVKAVRDALVKYLQQNTRSHDTWDLDFQLTEEQARAVLRTPTQFTIRGGRSPLAGQQQFELLLSAAEGQVSTPLVVQISRPPVVAVALHSLNRGTVVRPEDVQLASAVSAGEQGEVFRSLDEVVGRETTRAISAGKPLDRESLREPVVVRRGDVVTVLIRSPGIRIRTLARAKEEGGLGDLIALEALEDRKSYFARITGAQEVEVYGRATQAEPMQASANRTYLR